MLMSSYTSRGASLLLPLILAPIIISTLGIEFYGLIGVFVIVQGAIALLDLGIVPTVTRELSALRGRNAPASELNNTLYTIELVYLVLAACALLIGLVISIVVAYYWLHNSKFSADATAIAFTIMCAGATANLISGLFSATLLAMGRQIQFNLISTCFPVVNIAVSISGLRYFSWDIFDYLAWQASIAWASLLVIRYLAWKSMPERSASLVFSKGVIIALRRFATGVSITQILATLSMNMDRILLSRLLPTEVFGYYALGATVASSLLALVYPILAVASPRLTLAFNSPDKSHAADMYHFYCQMVCVAIVPTALTVAIFVEPLLLAWTQNPDVVQHASTPLRILALGWLFNGLMCVPYATQLAHGWVRLGLYGLAIGLVFQIPVLLYFVPRHGIDAAAWSWLVLELGFFLVAIPLMHTRILRGHAKQWYLMDTLIPAFSTLAVLAICYLVFQQLQQSFYLTRLDLFLYLGFSAFLAFLISIMSATRMRPIAIKLLTRSTS